ncbi:hypothetical protein TNCV_839191 [Trichonephila clavipes]|nr:hypothetical protein TNCV_839191 [Trichonephila clavipes]
MPPDRQCQIEAHKIRHAEGLDSIPVCCSFEHHAGDSSIWLISIPILWVNTLGVVRGLPPLFPFHQPHEMTCGLMTI